MGIYHPLYKIYTDVLHNQTFPTVHLHNTQALPRKQQPVKVRENNLLKFDKVNQ